MSTIQMVEPMNNSRPMFLKMYGELTYMATTKPCVPKTTSALRWVETKAPSRSYITLLNTSSPDHELFEFDAMLNLAHSTYGYSEVVAWIIGPLEDNSWRVRLGKDEDGTLIPVQSQEAAVLFVELMA